MSYTAVGDVDTRELDVEPHGVLCTSMISYQQALEIMLRGVRPLASERVALTAASGRILATPVVALHDMPPFDQSLVDGYALRSRDTRAATAAQPGRLALGQTLTAGESLEQPLAPRQAIRIMTGAALPPGANTVIKMEGSQVEASTLCIHQPLPHGLNIQRRGAEIRRHTVVLRQGERLTPQRIGVALALGMDGVEVIRRPRVALVAPGDELLPPGAPWQPGKKWCSNLYALDIRAQELGCTSVNLGLVADTLESLTVQLKRGLESDAVVILGASGRGDHDFATRAMAASGAEMLFCGVATSPGRSVTVARCGETPIFGLPGSPWAAFVGFEVFVWPVLRAMLSQRPVLPVLQTAALATPVQVHPGVTHFLPARLQRGPTGWTALPVENLLTLARAESHPLGLIVVPPHRRRLPAGARVRVQAVTAW
jgi:molybdenum cofactor synthesis domain-containing protein